MKRLLLALFVSVWCVLQPVQGELVQMLQKAETPESSTSVSPKSRARAFSALSALPADTDSFFAIARLGELFTGGMASGIPGADMAAGLDGFALGMSEAAVKDLQRLMPLFQVLTEAESPAAEAWLPKATPEAARAIVAQQRETQFRAGELLVQATQDYHLAPIYMVLSCKPGSEALLQQLSVLPLMIPVEADGPLVLMARGSSRGFYLRGDSLDLSKADLAPEHEAAIARNLEKARLYVMAEVLGNKLVLVICSNLDEVKLPRRVAQSLLGTDKMSPFDALMQRDALALGSCSPAVVNMCEELNFCAYRGAASFLGGVFRRLAGENSAMAAAAGAVEQLVQQFAALVPPSRETEQFMAWREADSIFVHLVSDAGGLSFAPGVLAHEEYNNHEDTVFFAEGTALQGFPSFDIAAVLQQVECVQQAYIDTLNPDAAASESASFRKLQAVRPGVEKLAAGIQKIHGALGGCSAVLVRENAAITLRAEVADAAALNEGTLMLQEAARELELPDCLAGESGLQVQRQEGVVLLGTGSGLQLIAPEGGTPVHGGAVFSLHVPALARGLARVGAKEADAVAWVASVLERLEGCSMIRDNQLIVRLRFQLAKGK